MQIARRKPIYLAGLAALVVACGVGFGEFGSEGSKQQPISEDVEFASSPWTKLGAGEDCTPFEGNTGCASDLCLRIAPGFPPKGVCSLKCPAGDDGACPALPTCGPLYPVGQLALLNLVTGSIATNYATPASNPYCAP